MLDSSVAMTFLDASITERDAGHAAAGSGARGGSPSTGSAGHTGMHEATGGAGSNTDSDAGDELLAGQDAAPQIDLKTYASGLSELFIDMPCDISTPVPIPEGMACSHAPNTQHVEKVVTFGGKPGTLYTVLLRVRAIWEPTNISGGEHPYPGVPFTAGGAVAQNADGSPSIANSYQQFFIQVSEPPQIYWLNNYQYAGHEIHKDDYEASLKVAAGAEINVAVHDGNELEIGNFAQLMFSDVPPYDTTPSLGQSLRLDVIKVEVGP